MFNCRYHCRSYVQYLIATLPCSKHSLSPWLTYEACDTSTKRKMLPGWPNGLDVKSLLHYRLNTKPKNNKENEPLAVKNEAKKYPIRKKREPTPPPREPTPPPAEPEEEMPNLRSSPTAFGRTLSISPSISSTSTNVTLSDVLGRPCGEDPFKGPSPDDTVLRAQQHSKGLGKS